MKKSLIIILCITLVFMAFVGCNDKPVIQVEKTPNGTGSISVNTTPTPTGQDSMQTNATPTPIVNQTANNEPQNTPQATPTTENHTHQFSEWKINKQASCQATGTKTRFCDCGETETEIIAKTKHTSVTDKAVKATCNSTGLTEGSHCSKCNSVLVAQKTVDKLTPNQSNCNIANGRCTRCAKVYDAEKAFYHFVCNHPSSSGTTTKYLPMPSSSFADAKDRLFLFMVDSTDYSVDFGVQLSIDGDVWMYALSLSPNSNGNCFVMLAVNSGNDGRVSGQIDPTEINRSNLYIYDISYENMSYSERGTAKEFLQAFTQIYLDEINNYLKQYANMSLSDFGFTYYK